jgi:quinol-cytochrome oxidoreductase complex cytochrome b subunit
VTDHAVEPGSDARAVPKRIALIRREMPARVLEDRQELTTTAPHLLLREVILVQWGLIALAVLSLLFDAPLEGIADPLHTPNPAKAPWYFVGLQELLHYFPPVVAGVLLPTLAVIGLVVIPYFRVNLEVVGLYERPWRRTLTFVSVLAAAVGVLLVVYRVWPVLVPTVVVYVLLALPALPACPSPVRRRLGRVPLADWLMGWFVAVAVVLTLIGELFRGPGWSWVWPWVHG